MRVHMCIYIYTCVYNACVSIFRPFVLLDAPPASTAQHTRVGASARERRTGGECGAQRLVVRVAGADRVGVEVRSVAAGVVAAPRVGRAGLHASKGLARGGHGGAARRLGHDPRGARRALVAARGTGHVRACSRQHRHGAAPRPCRRSHGTPVPGRSREYPRVLTQYILYHAASRPPVPGRSREYPRVLTQYCTATPPPARQYPGGPGSTREYPPITHSATPPPARQYPGGPASTHSAWNGQHGNMRKRQASRFQMQKQTTR
jgi:hypothetical protein